jgi:putative SOS response-associated peptidase YedK
VPSPGRLGEQTVSVSDLKAMLAPYPSDEMICWPVSTRVGSVKNNDPTFDRADRRGVIR